MHEQQKLLTTVGKRTSPLFQGFRSSKNNNESADTSNAPVLVNQKSALNPFPFISPSSSTQEKDNEMFAETNVGVLHSIFSPSVQDAINTLNPNTQQKLMLKEEKTYLDYEQEMWNQLCGEEYEASPQLTAIAEEDFNDSQSSISNEDLHTDSPSPFLSPRAQNSDMLLPMLSENDYSSKADFHSTASTTAVFLTPTSRLTEHRQQTSSSRSIGYQKKSQHEENAMTSDSAGKNSSNPEFSTPTSRLTKHSKLPVSTTHLTSDNSSSTVFLTPTSRLTKNSIHSQSKYTPISIHSTCNGLPMEMLSFDFVRNTQCVDDVRRIIVALETDQPVKYPSLLKIAKNRLDLLSKSIPRQISYGSQNNIPKSNSIPNLVSENMDDQSHQSIDEYSRCINHDDDASCSTTSSQTTYLPEDEFKEGDMKLQNAISSLETKDCENQLQHEIDAISEARSFISKSVKNILSERNDVEKDLSSQVLVLSSQLQEITASFEKQKIGLMSKIETLTKEKEEVENDLCILDDAMEDLRKNKDDALGIAKREHGDLRRQLSKLTEQIELEKKNTEIFKKEIEEKIRIKFESEINHLSSNVKELSGEKVNLLETIRLQRMKLIEISQRANLDSELVKKTRQKYHTMKRACGDYEIKIKAMEDTVEMLREALSVAGTNLSNEIRKTSEAHAKCSKLMVKNHKLKEENKDLTKKVQHYSKEAANANETIKKLRSEIEVSNTAHPHSNIDLAQLREERDRLEMSYQSQMNQLRSQLAQKGSMVSIDLYRKAVNEARKLQEELTEKNLQIRTLHTKLEKMNKEPEQRNQKHISWKSSLLNLSKKDSITTSDKATRLPEVNINEKLSISDKSLEENTDVTPNKNVFNIKSSSRVAAVRAAGGRAGLSQKLKKSRVLQTIQTNLNSMEHGKQGSRYKKDHKEPRNAQLRQPLGKENILLQ